MFIPDAHKWLWNLQWMYALSKWNRKRYEYKHRHLIWNTFELCNQVCCVLYSHSSSDWFKTLCAIWFVHVLADMSIWFVHVSQDLQSGLYMFCQTAGLDIFKWVVYHTCNHQKLAKPKTFSVYPICIEGN